MLNRDSVCRIVCETLIPNSNGNPVEWVLSVYALRKYIAKQGLGTSDVTQYLNKLESVYKRLADIYVKTDGDPQAFIFEMCDICDIDLPTPSIKR